MVPVTSAYASRRSSIDKQMPELTRSIPSETGPAMGFHPLEDYSILKGENSFPCSCNFTKKHTELEYFGNCRRPLGHSSGQDGTLEVEALLSTQSINSRSVYLKRKEIGKENTLTYSFVKPGVGWNKEETESLPPPSIAALLS